MTVESRQAQKEASTERALWLSLLLGPVIWGIHLMIVYPMTSLACEWGWFPFNVAGLSGLQFIELVVTIIAALLLLVSGYLAIRSWRKYRDERDAESKIPESARRPFVAYLSILLNGLFLLSVLSSIPPIFTIQPCL